MSILTHLWHDRRDMKHQADFPRKQFDDVVETLAVILADRIHQKISRLSGSTAAPLLNIEEAAAYLGRTPNAVRHLINKGSLKTRRFDRRLFIAREDLEGLTGNAR